MVVFFFVKNDDENEMRYSILEEERDVWSETEEIPSFEEKPKEPIFHPFDRLLLFI